MLHEPMIRRVPGSKKAVLMIHGIVGTPNHFRFLLPLVPADWSVYNILLDGHGGGVRDFSRTSMAKWKQQVAHQLDSLLAEYDELILVGHSMGTLFSIQEAVRRPEKIRQLYLLQVPLWPHLHPKLILQAPLGALGIVTRDSQRMMDDCGIRLEWQLWRYLGWIPRFLELFRECAATRAILGQLTVPCTCYQSKKDELVSNRSAGELQKHPHIHTVILPNSGHFGHDGEDLKLLQQDFRALFQ